MPALPSGTVTLLFTDIEGSTRLLQQLGERYADVLAEHQRLLRQAFGAHGGREVDTQGDAFFVAFPRAADAVQAALAAQRALAAHPWPEGAAVRVRMGLHTGEPAATGERYIGLAVHRAARIGAAGHGGQVLLSATTEAVLRDQLPAGVALRDLGEQRLKDFDRPERVYQLVIPGLPAEFPPLKVADPTPLPPLPVPLAFGDASLVGRERERALLRERLDAALSGRGGLVLIGGEAGIGKTALAEALGREALDRGARVAVGRCYDLAETPPYGPWREALAAIPRTPTLPPLPEALDPAGRGEAVASQAAVLAGAHAFLAAAAGERPLLLLLDDLHWADPASLDLLRSLARQAPAAPLLLVATYRADELTRRHPLYQLLPLLVREARATQLDLRALTREAIRALVRARYALPEAEEARLVAYLRDRAEGHPLFMGELLRTLEEEQLLQREDGSWALGDLGGVRVPTLLRQVIDGRLDRLGEEDRRLLGVAAVIGQEVPLDLWAAVAEAREEALYPAVERAVEARLLAETPDGGVRFAHALIREALYEGVLGVRRRALHRRAGEALAASSHPDPDAVAYHFRQAGDPRAVEWLIRSGERAQRAYAWLTAAERYEAALALTEGATADAGERAALLITLAQLSRYADPRRGISYLEEAARLAGEVGDRTLAAAALFDQGHLRCLSADSRRGLAAMLAALPTLEALPASERRRLPALTVQGVAPEEHYHRGALVIQLANVGRLAEAQALGAAMAARGPGTTARGLFGLGYVHACLGQAEQARHALADARAAYRAAHQYVEVAVTVLYEFSSVLLPYYADQPAEWRRLAAEAE